MAAEPELARVFLEHGSVESFTKIAGFLFGLPGAAAAAGEVTVDNVEDLLRWSEELGIEHVRSGCESFLITGQQEDAMAPQRLLDLAARHNLPTLYSHAVGLSAQKACLLDVGCLQEPGGILATPPVFASQDIRDDVVGAHIAMGAMRLDGEMRCRHRFADQTVLSDPYQRARLLWKSRGRVAQPVPQSAPHDWRDVQVVYPHHSMLVNQAGLPVVSGGQPGRGYRIAASNGAVSSLRF